MLIFVYRYTINLLLRHEDVGESIRELDSMIEMGEQFPESGDLLKLIGVLRATDIYWNAAKRQVRYLKC